jgi:hypothetical protein
MLAAPDRIPGLETQDAWHQAFVAADHLGALTLPRQKLRRPTDRFRTRRNATRKIQPALRIYSLRGSANNENVPYQQRVVASKIAPA